MFRWNQWITVACAILVVLPVAGEDEASTAAALQQAATADAAKVEFFEAKIRPALVEHYVAAFRHTEAGARDKAAIELKTLSKMVADRVEPSARAEVTSQIDGQLAKLA